MGSKQNKCCCGCDRCEADTDCCGCISRWLCVTLDTPYCPSCDEPDNKTELEWNPNWTAYELPGVLGAYVNQQADGTFECGNISIDLAFYFRRDEYGRCWFGLYSDCLGGAIEEQEIGEGSGLIDCDDLMAEFVVNFGGCSGGQCGEGTITTARIDKLMPSCAGCDCACRCLCVEIDYPLVFIDDTNQDQRDPKGLMCWDGSAYIPTDPTNATGAALGDLEIRIEEDEYGNCVFRITWEDDDYDALPGDCSNLTLEWDIPYGPTIRATCADCGGCGEIICCNNYEIPATLHLTLESGCEDIDENVVELTYSIETGRWHGPSNLGCLGGVNWSFYCDTGGTWRLIHEAADPEHPDCLAQVDNHPTVSFCSPFEMEFPQFWYDDNVDCENDYCCPDLTRGADYGTFSGVVTV